MKKTLFAKKTLSGLLIGAAALTTMPAFAQDQDQDQATTARNDNTIIVTARKKEENLQDVPGAVAVVTAASIENLALDNLQDIAKTTAGLFFDESLGRDGNRPVIRGQANILGESGVAVFIDGIYFTGSIADYDVDSIERVEVVKGPQSALYGRNTYAGAINIISRTRVDEFGATLTADISENDRYQFTGSIRAPLAEGLSGFVGGRYYTNGGEFINQFDGSPIGEQESYSVSGGLTYDNGGRFRAAIRGYFNGINDGQPAIAGTSVNDNNCFFDNGAFYGGRGRYFCGVLQPQPINTDFTRQFPNNGEDVGLRSDTYNASLRLDYDITDQLTLTSLTGYNSVSGSLVIDGDYSPNSFQAATFATFPAGPVALGIVNGPAIDFSFSNASAQKDWSQELRLNYLGNGFDIMVGGYYFDQSDNSRDTRTLPTDAAARAQAQSDARQRALCSPARRCFASFFVGGPTGIVVPRNANELDIRNIAVFGSVSVDVTDRLTIGVEGRYSEERIRQFATSADLNGPPPRFTIGEATFKRFTPRVLVDYQISSNHLLYGSYAQGEKPGGFNGPLAIEAGQPTFDDEDVEAFEIGSKNTFLDGALTANLAIYRNDITGYQLSQNVFLPPNSISSIVNAGDARINGLELELVARPDNHFTLTANYSLADTRFKNGFDEQQGVLNDVADNRLVDCSTGDQFPGLAGCQSAFGSIAGKRIPRAPVHQIFFDADYRNSLGTGNWDFFVGGNVNLLSSSFAQVHNLAETGDSVVADARLGVDNGNIRVQAYVKNLFDEDAVGQVLRFADANASFQRSFALGLRPGRRFGVVITARY